MNKKQLIITLILTTLATACTGKNGKFDLTKPPILDMRAPEGPPIYQSGFNDGCESGLASTNTKLMLFIGAQKFTLDSAARHHPMYKKMWRIGFNYCGFSMRTISRYPL